MGLEEGQIAIDATGCGRDGGTISLGEISQEYR